MLVMARFAGRCFPAFSFAALLLGGTYQGVAQATPAGGAEARPEKVSPVMGFNAALDYSAQHTSDTGWSNIVTPTITYRFNEHISLDANVPWYPTVNAYVSTTKAGVTTTTLSAGRNLLGDANVGAHVEFKPGKLVDLVNVAGGLNTGNVRYGLSANADTYNVTNHMDYELGMFTPDIEFGIGDSSALANQVVHKAYTAVGTLANFQVGTWIDLPWNLGLDLEAYEDLPIGAQNVYGTITKKNKKTGKTTTTQVLSGTGVAEDNGFNAELDVPIGHHVTLNGTYERSLVQGLDTASAGVNFVLRSPKVEKEK